jgi:intracellular septation protein
LYVAYNFSEAFWVKFKVLGFTAITFVFIIVQMLWLFRVIKNDKQREPGTD